ncbi:MAG: class I SAM-dependent methyltransferase [Anaerolineae bacterium]|nr:class I SAM-dependent methyltransferase [Anaerolineae bacterium]
MNAGSTRTSYDRVAADYAAKFLNELEFKPFDRHLLNLFAELTHEHGLVADIGCGPGQIARYLHERGAAVIGLDLSPQMIAQAQRLHPPLLFQIADMQALPIAGGSLAGITAFYSIIHILRASLPDVFREFHRVLQPSGYLLLSFHIGSQTVHLDNFFEKPVSLDFLFYEIDVLRSALEAAGFKVALSAHRAPYPQEHQSQRGYLLAQRGE